MFYSRCVQRFCCFQLNERKKSSKIPNKAKTWTSKTGKSENNNSLTSMGFSSPYNKVSGGSRVGEVE